MTNLQGVHSFLISSTWCAEVCVLSTYCFPSLSLFFRYKVSCISVAGCDAGIFTDWKFSRWDTTWCPYSIWKPILRNTSSTCLLICDCNESVQDLFSIPGVLRSIVSVCIASVRSCSCNCVWWLKNASSMACWSSCISCPAVFFSSGLRSFIILYCCPMSPLFPR